MLCVIASEDLGIAFYRYKRRPADWIIRYDLKTLAYNILKSLEDNAVRDIEFSELGPCTECDNEILSLPLKALTMLSCGHVFHRFCIEKKLFLAKTGECPFPDCKRSIDIIEGADTRRDSQSSSPETPRENEVLDQDTDDGDGEEEVEMVPLELTQSEKTPSSGKGKKRANNATESSTSKKSKKHVQPEDSNILNKLIQELSSDTTRLSEIKERRGLQREAVLEVEIDRTLFNLYLKTSNAEERKEKAHHELIGTYYYYGEELEKRLAHYRSSYAEYEALKKLYDEVKDQLPKEVTKNALRKKSDRARKFMIFFLYY